MTTTTSPIDTSALTGFTASDFEVFQLDGLAERMAGIQERIQPKFRALGERLAEKLEMLAGREMHLHIAKHARRTVNPPKDTWLAICDNKRGYKAHPHFQLGLFDDHLFLWLALIYEVPNKRSIAAAFLDALDDVIATVPEHYVVSLDHMQKAALKASEMSRDDWRTSLVRFRDVKKAELLIGRHIAPNDPLLRDGEALLACALSTYEQLMPLYKLASSR